MAMAADDRCRAGRSAGRQGAAVVAFDILFAEPDQTSPEQFVQRLPPEEVGEAYAAFRRRPSHDVVLADAIGRSPTVLATRLGRQSVRDAAPGQGGVRRCRR